MSERRIVLAACVSLILAGCSFAPRYSQPSTAPAPEAYREVGEWKLAQPADTHGRGSWWGVFNDPKLDELQGRVTQANQDLKAAFARLQQARAQTRVARSGYFPNVLVDAAATRSRASANAPAYNGVRPPAIKDFVLDADLSYEIDVWGRVRNTVATARAGEQASAADLATLDLSTHAELATAYFTLRGQDAQLELLDQAVADYRQALELTEALYEGGAGVLADVEQAKAQLETARTQAEDMRLSRAQTEHAIATLVGESASTFHLDPVPLAWDALPPAIDPGLPSSLLERRPDVAAAERRVAAANAQIGVARAAYFPQFSLGATAGFESASASNWITAPSRLWSIGPSAVLTVFDAGRHRAQSAAAQAAYDEQVANYRAVALEAFQQVEDNLAALRHLAAQSDSQKAAVAATAGALEQARYRYEGGAVTYLEIVATENAALAARQAAVNIQTRRMIASVLLVKALGGGWTYTAALAGVPAVSQ